MRNFVWVCMLGVLLFSCDEKRVYDTYKTLPKHWEKKDKVLFLFENNDTIQPYNLFLNLRNTNDYEFSNLFLITTFKSPNNNEVVDTLEYEMAKPTGEWLGEGYGTKENKLFFKEKYTFKEKGAYTLTVTHAMRKNGNIKGIETLEGVTEIGFRIEKITD